MIPLLLLATLLAGQGINADLIWYDELTSISHAGGIDGPFSPLDVAGSIREHSPKHAPLFFQLLAGWAWLVGWHHAPLRCLPLFCGILALAWTYRIGADFLRPGAGLWAAAFLCCNVFWLDYNHEIRMYSLQFMLLMALIWLYFFVLRHRACWRHWLCLTLCAAACLYTQPFAAFFLLALASYHLLFLRRRPACWGGVLAILSAGILYLPWLPVTLLGLRTKFDTAATAVELSEALGIFLRFLSNGNVLLLLLFLSAAALAMRADKRAFPFFWIGLATVALLLLVNEGLGLIPARRARYFLLAWGMFALFIGNGCACLKPRWLAPIALCLYLMSGFALRAEDDYLEYQGTVGIVHAYPPLGDYIEALRGQVQPQDFLLGFSATDFINHRGKRVKSTADYYMETLLGIDGAFLPTHYRDERLQADLARKLDDHPYILLAYNPQSAPPNLAQAQATLLRDYQPCAAILEEPELYVQRYEDRAFDCGRSYRAIHYDNGIHIVDYFASYDSAQKRLRLLTGWEVPDPAQLELYNISLQIIDAQWQKLHQAPDEHLYHNVLKWYEIELSTAGLAPGDYQAVIILYDRYHSSNKVRGVDQHTGEAGTILPLLHFTVDAD